MQNLHNMTAQHVADHMQNIFREVGLPEQIVSDNGICYPGEEFQDQ